MSLVTDTRSTCTVPKNRINDRALAHVCVCVRARSGSCSLQKADRMRLRNVRCFGKYDHDVQMLSASYDLYRRVRKIGKLARSRRFIQCSCLFSLGTADRCEMSRK